MKNCFIAFIIIVAVSGCSSTPETVETVYDNCKAEYDDYQKTTKVTSPAHGEWFGPARSYLRSTIKDGKPLFFQLYVTCTTESYAKRFNEAYDLNGDAFELVRIDTDVSVSSSTTKYFETVGILLSREYLDNSTTTGLEIQISGSSGKQVVRLPAIYVEGFLRKIDEHLPGKS